MNATAREIHLAVDSAADTLLMDAPYDSSLVQGLQELGFTSAENVNDYNDHAKGNERARYYQQRYPHHKFITKWQMEKIREKYNLMEGSLERFKGAIPAKNITEMMNFRMVRQDIQEKKSDFASVLDTWSRLYEQQMFASMGIPDIITRGRAGGKSFDRVYIDEAKELLKRPSVDIKRSYGPPSFEDSFKQQAEKRAEDARERQEEMNKRNRGYESLTFAQVNKEFPGAIKITADKALFNAPDPVLDPIVTIDVNGGYLIITAWGDEARDPDVLNQTMN